MMSITYNYTTRRRGSTPSLATTFQAFSRIASCRPSPLSVRYFLGRSGSVPAYDDGEGLKLELRRFQSASVRGVAENRSQNCPCRSHAILADTVGITLQGQLNITMAKQSLYRFGVSSNTDQKRCQAVTQIVKAKSARIVIHQSALVVSVR